MLSEGPSVCWSSTQTDTQFPQHLEGLERRRGEERGREGEEEGKGWERVGGRGEGEGRKGGRA